MHHLSLERMALNNFLGVVILSLTGVLSLSSEVGPPLGLEHGHLAVHEHLAGL